MPVSTRFDTARVLVLSVGHAIHDAYPAFLAPLVPLLKEKLGLCNALAGTLATFLRSSSLVQPFIGYMADRMNARCPRAQGVRGRPAAGPLSESAGTYQRGDSHAHVPTGTRACRPPARAAGPAAD